MIVICASNMYVFFWYKKKKCQSSADPYRDRVLLPSRTLMQSLLGWTSAELPRAPRESVVSVPRVFLPLIFCLSSCK